MTQIENKLHNLLERIAYEEDFTDFKLQITPVTSLGANYSSILYNATVQGNNKHLNLFIKIAAIDKKTREEFNIQIYEVELYFYTTMVQLFRDLENKHSISEEHKFLLPKYYGANTAVNEEMLVLEDLKAKGFSTYDRFKTIDWPYASTAVKELAKFHALAMAFEKEYLGEYEKFCPDYKTAWLNEERFQQYWVTKFISAVEVVKAENRDLLKKFFNNVNIDMVQAMNKPVKRKMLIHTDFRASNLMHKYNEDGTVEIVLIDYQTIKGGCPVIDLIYFIINGSDKEFRKMYYQKLVDFYYEELSAAMTRLGLDLSYYSKEDFNFELKEKLPYGLIFAAYSLPLVTVQIEEAPKLEKGYSMTSFAEFKSSNLFPSRLNGIVDDYIRWGILK